MRFFKYDLIFIFALLIAAGTGLATLYNLIVVEKLVSGSTQQVGAVIRYALGVNMAFWVLSVIPVVGLWFYLRQRQSLDDSVPDEMEASSPGQVVPPCNEQMVELVRTVKETLEVIQPLVIQIACRQETAAGTTTAGATVSSPGEQLRTSEGSEEDCEQEFWPDFPKGLNRVTLKQVLAYLEEHNETGVSSEEIATGVGLTVW
ncbi:hypothetical protein [Desulfofundulus sp.]|uniref:hypothetical protein n=1 Tax=Desulfofundulus sp. TaxID=2282750 RepID=UPI003C72B774